ncbi:TetR family transcriptional regulator [Microlunatus endophyticus]|uniref:TetR family transcriptional regulator n=1 Tax=Microlunatus endophyticus TaxID=1716077 RepID=A0A917W2G5_9ACTN|nr:TetR/AcrR family transcriptional regulator C-terminal domain-containing protein [Microlunatus endophyticus]GGL60461.1 TetR family transcriptional regulator [Microlunatus endophyticus]
MVTTSRAADIRSAGLTSERIVRAAIDVLDAEGLNGLTFRTLAVKLKTGHGAIQRHIINKDKLLVTATTTALTPVLEAPGRGLPPRPAIHAVALAVFDAIDAHPWLSSQLFAVPWQPAMAELWEQIGRPVAELGVREDRLFTAVSTLVSYVVGVGSQNALNTHSLAAGTDRASFLDAVATTWESLDAVEHPFVGRVAGQLRAHDDRKEFLAGIDIILAGVGSLR